MKSYMRYILSKFAIIVLVPDNLCQCLNTCKNADQHIPAPKLKIAEIIRPSVSPYEKAFSRVYAFV